MGFPIDNILSNSTGKTAGKPGDTGDAIDRAGTESMSVAQWIAAAGGLGLAPIAPGTFGSAGGVVLFLGVLRLGGGDLVLMTSLYLALVVVLFGLGIWAAGEAERDWSRHDDHRIVIDEVVGQLIALSPLVWFFGSLTNSPTNSPSNSPSFSLLFLSVVTGFVLFRLFDVWKPGAIRWAERHFESGLGVMADDAVAGLYSAVVLCLAGFGGLGGLGGLGGPDWGLGWGIAPGWTQ